MLFPFTKETKITHEINENCNTNHITSIVFVFTMTQW